MASFATVFLLLSLSKADVYTYNSCEGAFPAGGFPETSQRFQLHAVDSAEYPQLSIHLEGPSYQDFRFQVQLKVDSDSQTYVGQEYYDSQLFAQLQIDLTKCSAGLNSDSPYCPAVLTTNISGVSRVLKLTCGMNKKEYPSSPGQQHQCNHPHCL